MKRYQSIDGDLYLDPDGMYVLHSDHEAALKAAVAFETFAQTIKHQCRGRIGDLVAQMALDQAAAIRKGVSQLSNVKEKS